MIKRIPWKAILTGFTWTTCLAGLVVLMSFIEHKKQEVNCVGLKVFIPGEQSFVSRKEVERILWSVNGDIRGKALSTINSQALEDALKANPFIKRAKVYADMTGVVWVRIEQREPLLRIFNLKNQDYYVDENGYKIPVSPNFTAQVVVATGNIAEDLEGRVATLKTPVAKELFKVAQYLSKDTLWSKQIEQLYVNANEDIQLVPRVGDQQIIIGTADSLETKLNKLLVFYKQAMPKVGWNTYKTINLKYSKQIICTKSGLSANIQSLPADTLKTDSAKVKQ
ncbi:MAG: cell division protein FtsQ/DivIB [Sphingobacteriaceae bacterium]